MKLMFFVIIFFTYSCSNDKQDLSLKKEIEEIDSLNIGIVDDKIHLDFNNTGRYYEIDTTGLLIEKSSYNYFNEYEVYTFDEYNTLYSRKKYLPNENGRYLLQDVVFYVNGMVDYINSDVLDVHIKDETKDSLLICLNFIAPNDFIKADIFYGKKVKVKKDVEELKSFTIYEKNNSFWASKKDFMYDNFYIEFSTFSTFDIKNNSDRYKTVMKDTNDRSITYFKIHRVVVSHELLGKNQ